MRSDAMKLVRPIVEQEYGFLDPDNVDDDAEGDGILAENKENAAKYLKENYFVFAVCPVNFLCSLTYDDVQGRQGDQPKHPYRHPAIGKVLKRVWFAAGRESHGVKFSPYFNPISLTMIALIVTFVRLSLYPLTYLIIFYPADQMVHPRMVYRSIRQGQLHTRQRSRDI